METTDDDKKSRAATSELAIEKMMEPYRRNIEKYGEIYPGAIQDAIDAQRYLKARRAREEGKR
jgi:hypothetical protein